MNNPQHDLEQQRFSLQLGESGEAVLRYERKDSEVDFYYVYVPVDQRGEGHAAELLMAAFEWAREENLTVIPSCPYIAHSFLQRHPEFANLTPAGRR